jgi:hypothetical protein
MVAHEVRTNENECEHDIPDTNLVGPPLPPPPLPRPPDLWINQSLVAAAGGAVIGPVRWQVADLSDLRLTTF